MVAPDRARRPARALAAARDERVLAVVSQLLASARNFAFILIGARLYGESTFGYLALLATVVYGGLEVLRAIASHPLAIRFAGEPAADDPSGGHSASESTADHDAALAGSAVVGVGWSIVGAAVAVPVVAVAVPEAEPALLVGLGLVPAIAVHDTIRTGSINLGRPERAVVLDGAWLTLLLLGLAIVGLADAGPVAAVIAWAGTGGLVAVASAAAIKLPIGLAEARRYRAAVGSLGQQMAVQVAFETVPTRGVTILVTALTAATTAGAIRGAEVLVGPSLLLWSGLVPVALRRARRSVTAGAAARGLREVASLMGVVAAAIVANLAVVIVLPSSIGVRLLGDSWRGAQNLAPTVAMLWLALVALSVATISLRSIVRVDLANRVVAAVAVVAVPAAAVATLAIGPRAGLAANAAVVLAGAASGLVAWGRHAER